MKHSSALCRGRGWERCASPCRVVPGVVALPARKAMAAMMSTKGDPTSNSNAGQARVKHYDFGKKLGAQIRSVLRLFAVCAHITAPSAFEVLSVHVWDTAPHYPRTLLALLVTSPACLLTPLCTPCM